MLFEDNELRRDMGQVQVTPDAKDSRLVSDEFGGLWLAAVDHHLHPELVDGQAVLGRVIFNVVDRTEPHPFPFLHDQGPRHPDVRPLVLYFFFLTLVLNVTAAVTSGSHGTWLL